MKKHLPLSLLVIIFLIPIPKIYSQDWIKLWQDSNANFYDVQKSFNKYWKKQLSEKKEKDEETDNGIGKDDNESEMAGYEQFKRWEYFMEPRVYPSGKLDPTASYQAYQEYLSQSLSTRSATPPWRLIGPTNTIPTGGGAGRANCVRISGTNTYIGAPAGGLWKSANGGTWSTNTDQLASIGVTDVAIDPNNSQIMYLATGDGDHADTYSIGVLKSTDGGNTWNTTGLNWATFNVRKISKLIINPLNTNTILAATSNGVYRTINAGASWTQVRPGTIRDIEMKPDDTAIVYIASNSFARSVNGGATFTTITGSGLPASASVERFAIAVTPADPNYVYVVASEIAGANKSGLLGVYRSTDGGLNFTTQATTPNLLGWVPAGNDQGGQGWYTLSIASSPTNKDEVIVGGVNVWRSTNGGVNWTLNAQWQGSGAPYIHADIHDLIYTSGTTYYAGTDGGIFKTTNSGTSWTDLSNGLQIAQAYSIGLSATNANLHISGWQDNGTNRYNGSTWNRVLGGDGMMCFIDWSDNNYMYGEQYNGDFRRSTNGGNNFSAIKTGLTETGGWVTPWCQDPVTPTTLYGGFVNIFKTTDRGNNWSQLGTLTGTGTVVALAVAPSNPQYIYAAKSTVLFGTTDGGTTWNNITGTLPVGSASITRVAVKHNDPQKVWVTFSGFSSGNKVFVTTDGGSTWTNISTGLPNIPADCVMDDTTSAATDAIYVGTDVGVYYRDNNSGGFIPYMTNLPNVVVQDLQIFYPTKKLRAATFGRAIWETDLYSAANNPPTAAFISTQQQGCPGVTIQYTDQTSPAPTGWNWSFPGGTPATSNLQNPTVTYNTPGQYDVTLIGTNGVGSDTILQTNYITVNTAPPSPTTTGDTRCGAGIVNLSATGSGGELQWFDSTTAGNQVDTGATYSPTISVTKTYYVQEVITQPSQYVGKVDSVMGTPGTFFNSNDAHGLVFDAIKPVRIKTIKVYAGTAGNRTIQLLSAVGGTVLNSVVVNIPAGQSIITLNFDVPIGTQYFLKVTGSLISLYRSAGGASYPYAISGLISITGTDISGSIPNYYYYFYNWEVQELSCASPRVPVTGTINTCAGIKNNADASGISIFPNPTSGLFETKIELGTAEHVTIEIYNILGKKVYSMQGEASGTYNKQIDISEFASGVYMLHIVAGQHEKYFRLMKNK